jgi:MFS family permease
MADRAPSVSSSGSPASSKNSVHEASSAAAPAAKDAHDNSIERIPTSRSLHSTSHPAEKTVTPAQVISAALAPPDQAEVEYATGFRLIMVVVALCLAVFLVALDRLIIVTAIPRITDRFDSLGDVGWYGSSYLMTMCAVQLSYGKMYAMFPIKATFLSAIGIFELGSLICAAAPSSNAFIVGRAIAGIGCAGIWSGAFVIIAYTVPIVKRPLYTGYISAMFGIAGILGPILGGAFSDSPRLTWRFCFWINLPIGFVSVLVIAFVFKSPHRKAIATLTWRQKLAALDFAGLTAFLPAVVCIILALQYGGTKWAWSDGRSIALFVLFGVLMIAFIGIQIWRQENATIPPRIMANRTIYVGFWFSFAILVSFPFRVFPQLLPALGTSTRYRPKANLNRMKAN